VPFCTGNCGFSNHDFPVQQGTSALRHPFSERLRCKIRVRGIADTLPQRLDLREQLGDLPAYDQGDLQSCTANAIAGAFEFLRRKARATDGFTPSRLYIYYREREHEGTLATDSGAGIRTGIKVMNKFGAPPEDDWPYDVVRFAERPPSSLDTKAELYQALTYSRVERDLLDPTRGLRTALAQGFPVIFGFSVYESYRDTEDSGRWPLPGPGEKVEFGHAALAVGYEPVDGRPHAICRNSWGTSWGERGYFRMPMEYLVNPGLSDDFWVITSLG
jgi:C1A family cysteine protease